MAPSKSLHIQYEHILLEQSEACMNIYISLQRTMPVWLTYLNVSNAIFFAQTWGGDAALGWMTWVVNYLMIIDNMSPTGDKLWPYQNHWNFSVTECGSSEDR